MIEREKRLKIPTLFYNGESWEPFKKYPKFKCYTDKMLSGVLQVSIMRVGMWRKAGKIPFEMGGSFAIYDVNKVIQALKQAGYEQDPNLKFSEYEK